MDRQLWFAALVLLAVAGIALTISVPTVAAGSPVDDRATIQSEAGEIDSFGGGYTDIGEAGDDQDEDAEGDEAGARVVGEWWGLGGEAREAPYLGLAELGVVLLVVGVGGYSLGKRTSIVPLRYRRRLLQGHEWTVLAGTGLTVPHFVAVEEWEGLGLAVALLLAIEVASGLYGRHLHRHVVRLGNGEESPSVVGRLFEGTKNTLFSRWRRVHVMLTLVTGVVLFLHIVTAIGD